jgi:hypothetical protein
LIKASHGAAIFGWFNLLGIPFVIDWNNIREYRQHQTDLNMKCKIPSCHYWDYKVGDQVLLKKDSTLCKSGN